MSDRQCYCVIMAGGIGSRFWPMSRTDMPKQFLDVLGLGRTLIQQTYGRFLEVCPPENILVVTNERYAKLVKEQLPEMGNDQIIMEPARRNTAPCIAYANHRIAAKDPNAVIIVAPSDHLVTKEKAFQRTIDKAIAQARSGDQLITLGIMPSRPDTGYGYIQFTDEEGTIDPDVKRVKTFTEKPDLETAQRFLESGDFLWNSGIFVWTLKSIQTAFDQHLPEMQELFREGDGKYGTTEEVTFIDRIYGECANISIDYGIMEKAGNVYVVKSEFGWSDLGTWGSLYTHLKKDPNGNASVGKHVMIYDSKDTIVHASQDDRLIVLQGLDDHIVVSTAEALLVCRKQDEQKIRQFVNDVKASKGDKYV